MAAPPVNIPLASLPRLAASASLWSLSFGLAFLLLLLGLDTWRSKSKKTHWIPGESLVLGALSLQLLGLICQPIVNILDSKELNTDSVEKMGIKILGNVFMALRGRAIVCFFIGNMVDNVARSRDWNVWSDMFALSISTTGVVIHLAYEIYIVMIYFVSKGVWWYWSTVLYLGTHIIIFVSIFLLVLLLGSAIFTSKSIHKVVAQRFPLLLSRSEHRNTGLVVWWEAVEEHVVRSWITAWTHQPQYIITRSILISSVGFLVMICVLFCLGFSLWGWIVSQDIIIPEEDRFDWLRCIVVVVQWIFILPGWAIVCWRWLTAVVFYPRQMVFCNHYTRRILMGRLSHEFSVLYNLHNNGGLVGQRNHGDFVKYLDVLIYIPGENPAGVWIANLKSIQEMKARMTEGESHGKNCKALISLLEKKTMQRSTELFAFLQRKSQFEKDFNTGKSSSKMSAVSLLTIIIELSAFYQDYGGYPAGPAADTVEHCIEACCEAWGIMELVENSDPEAPSGEQTSR